MMAAKCDVTKDVGRWSEPFRGWEIIADSLSGGIVILLYIMLSFILLALS